MRLRVAEIEHADLSLFDFDYDLTFMVFFISADEQIYGRYGGRDAKNAESRMSLAGLNYAMKAALEIHRNPPRQTSKQDRPAPKYIRDYPGGRNRRGCIHCHQVKEIINADLKRTGQWTRDDYWRSPLPDNLGILLEVDRGDVVKAIAADSSAEKAGLQPGDVLEKIGSVSVNSLGDAQFALDKAPKQGTIDATWLRGGKQMKGQLTLDKGWRKADLAWRPSMRNQLPSARLFGRDLDAKERKAHGLSEKQLAFWQKYPVSDKAKAAGVQEGDIILGFDNKLLELNAYDFLRHVRGNYLIGDRVTIDVLRNGKRLKLPMSL